MKRRAALLLVSALLLGGILISFWPTPSSPVTVSFVGYTTEYRDNTFGHFRITNHSKSKYFICDQGPVALQIKGQWIQDVERLGRHLTNVQPGESSEVIVFVPPDATSWRSSFTLTTYRMKPLAAWQREAGELCERWGIQFGKRFFWGIEHPFNVTSETIARREL